jgi:hypothetical protein
MAPRTSLSGALPTGMPVAIPANATGLHKKAEAIRHRPHALLVIVLILASSFFGLQLTPCPAA